MALLRTDLRVHFFFSVCVLSVCLFHTFLRGLSSQNGFAHDPGAHNKYCVYAMHKQEVANEHFAHEITIEIRPPSPSYFFSRALGIFFNSILLFFVCVALCVMYGLSCYVHYVDIVSQSSVSSNRAAQEAPNKNRHSRVRSLVWSRLFA